MSFSKEFSRCVTTLHARRALASGQRAQKALFSYVDRIPVAGLDKGLPDNGEVGEWGMFRTPFPARTAG
jgi:hypothetical protein